jgi:lipoyl(octanoyl) transferase
VTITREAISAAPRRFFAGAPVGWHVEAAPVGYEAAVAAMEARAAAIASGDAAELVWLIEHPPLYTAGTSARDADLLAPRFPVFTTGRGGQFTYHGPGQRVAYVMLDLRRRGADLRRFVADLEDWLIHTLSAFDVAGERREDRVGVWVRRPDKGDGCEDKIAAIGIRVKRWISLHGVSLNVEPDLAHFDGIVPCGVGDRRYGVTSLANLGRRVTLPQVDAAMRRGFEVVFGQVGEETPAGVAATPSR